MRESMTPGELRAELKRGVDEWGGEPGTDHDFLAEFGSLTLARMERGRLATECAKLDPKFEKALAEEGLGQQT